MRPFNYHKPTGSVNVLLVDEDPYVANVLRQALGNDFKLKVITNGIEAMHWLEQGNYPDLIITELEIPHLDGHELIQLVRGSNLMAHLPIIVLSTQDDSSIRIECLESGADAYLTKPFNPFEVRAKARAILRRAQASMIMAS
ncbi:MAG: response regulator [Cytophagaceae bacterium]|nr:response regulator [Cytophagaceae bacterium]